MATFIVLLLSVLLSALAFKSLKKKGSCSCSSCSGCTEAKKCCCEKTAAKKF